MLQQFLKTIVHEICVRVNSALNMASLVVFVISIEGSRASFTLCVGFLVTMASYQSSFVFAGICVGSILMAAKNCHQKLNGYGYNASFISEKHQSGRFFFVTEFLTKVIVTQGEIKIGGD